jgi:hypothetical protein
MSKKLTGKNLHNTNSFLYFFRFKQAKKLVRNKVVFCSKIKKKKFKNTTPVRDKDITHFTGYVLQKHTRVILKKAAKKDIVL